MNQVDPAEWRGLVSRVLRVWSGYQLALEHRSGGDDTQLKHEWLVEVLSEHIESSKGLKAEELEGWLGSILYEDFDLVLEDDSLFHTALFLLEAFGYMKKNESARLEQLLRGLPSEESVDAVKKQSRVETQEGESDEEMDGIEEDDESNEEMGEDEAEQRPQRQRNPKTTTDDDGWTTVHRR